MCHTVQYIAVNTIHTHYTSVNTHLTHTAASTVSLYTLQCGYRGEAEDEDGDVRSEGTVCNTCYDPNNDQMLAVTRDCKYLSSCWCAQ